ncbi:MAG: hypothetical protein ACOYNR_10930 [Blastocatellia bacterium]|jgi:hypothetical protein
MSKWTTQNASEELITLAIAGIDAQIQELQQKKESLLAQVAAPAAPRLKRGRPAATPTGAKRRGRKPGKKAEIAPVVKAAKGRPRKVRDAVGLLDVPPTRKKRAASPLSRKRTNESAKTRSAREKIEQEPGESSN